MKDKNANIVMFTLLGVIFIVWALLNTPIYITRTYTAKTQSVTLDAVRLDVNWTAKYKAPLILPKELREDAEMKIELYGVARVHAFTVTHTGVYLYNMGKAQMQKEFEDTDGIREIIRLFTPKIDNVKSVIINEIQFELYFKDKVKEREKIKHVADSLRNFIIALL